MSELVIINYLSGVDNLIPIKFSTLFYQNSNHRIATAQSLNRSITQLFISHTQTHKCVFSRSLFRKYPRHGSQKANHYSIDMLFRAYVQRQT